MSYKLCFASQDWNGGTMFFFTDKFKTQWGDDWRDRYWKDNAGTPYVWDDSRDAEYNKNCGHIRVIAVWVHWQGNFELPGEGYSVEEINKGRVAWAYSEEHGSLHAGATMAETFKFLSKFGCMYSELKQIGDMNCHA